MKRSKNWTVIVNGQKLPVTRSRMHYINIGKENTLNLSQCSLQRCCKRTLNWLYKSVMKKQKFLKNAPTFLLLTKHLNTWCDCTHLNEPHRTFSDTGKWNCDCIFVNYEYGVLWSPYSTYSHIRHFLLINTFPHPIWLWPLSLQCNASIPHYDWRQLVLERMSSFVWTNGLVHSYYLVSGSVWLRETYLCHLVHSWVTSTPLPTQNTQAFTYHKLKIHTAWESGLRAYFT